jgi:hypothetical protein
METTTTRKTRKIRRGGGTWYRFIFEKPSEITHQLRLMLRSLEKGYSITTLTNIGNWIRNQGVNPVQKMVRLDKLFLWHPVRGKSQRAFTRKRTNVRRNAMEQFLRSYSNQSNPSNQSNQKIMITGKDIESIPAMKSADPMSGVFVTPGSFYILSSGNGRVQSIKEAATSLGIPFTNIFVEITVYDIGLPLCKLFLKTANEFREDGYFDSSKHAANRRLFPTDNVKSCTKRRRCKTCGKK